MWETLLQAAASNGVWAVMFCSLLIYQLKDSRAREKKYQATIRQLGDGLQAVRELDEKIENIHKDMRSRLDEGFRLDRVRQGEQS